MFMDFYSFDFVGLGFFAQEKGDVRDGYALLATGDLLKLFLSVGFSHMF